jgi:hypothetical protein
MGKFSGKNTTRDFWRFCKTPIAAQRYDSLRWGVIPLIENLTVLETAFLFYPKKSWSIFAFATRPLVLNKVYISVST